MSEATTPEEPQSEAPEKKSGGGLKLLGGVVGLIGVGASLALMAVPSKEQDHPFKGPYYLPLFEEEFVSNVADDHFTRFLKTSPAVEAFAYDETYTTQRAGDLLYQSWLQNDLGMLLRSMSLEEVYGGTEGQLFAQRVRRTVEPILFPVHIGTTLAHLDRDEESGLRPGDSYRRATFRGRFHDHVLKVDAVGSTLQLDEGEPVPFSGDEVDLFVPDQTGEGIYVDVSTIEPDVVGEVPVGIHGRVRQVFLTQNIAQ